MKELLCLMALGALLSGSGTQSRPEETFPMLPLAAVPPAAVLEEEGRRWAQIKEDSLEGVALWQEKNPDVVGWLYVPGTTLDSRVLQSDDNLYYLRHNEEHAEDKNGALMADCRAVFGGRENQSQNMVIYGHSKDENPDGGVETSREYEHFTELKRFQELEYCKKTPYVMFTTPEDTMTFEIFAVFHTRTDFYYIDTDPEPAQLRAILEEARQKSLFDFDVEVDENDRLLTLSTCCRRIIPTYPNGYRFVVMGRLVPKGEILKEEAVVVVNPKALTPENIY